MITMLITAALWLVALLCLGVPAVLLVVALVIQVAVPMRDEPRYKFNAPLPRLLAAAGCAALGWIWFAKHFASAQLRCHEFFHFLEARRKGRWRHLYDYIDELVQNLQRWGFEQVETPSGRLVLRAYWDHSEERAARAYAEANWQNFRPPGNP